MLVLDLTAEPSNPVKSRSTFICQLFLKLLDNPSTKGQVLGQPRPLVGAPGPKLSWLNIREMDETIVFCHQTFYAQQRI